MKKQTTLNNLLQYDEKQLDFGYTADNASKFHYIELPARADRKSQVLEQNSIIFIIEGSCSFSYDQYINRIFFAGDIIFIPKSALVTRIILEDVKFLRMTFDMPLNLSDRQYVQQQWEIVNDITYDFTSLKMNYPISVFINSLIYLMKNGGDCAELHEAKHKEIFIILRLFYPKEQFAEFFYPIIGESFNFKNFVLKNYVNCCNLKELIERSNMHPNVFMRRFKKEFGMSGYQWMLKQMCNRIQHRASQPEVTVKEIMCEVGIESPTHFNRICKRYFDQTPKQLIDFCQRNLAVE